MTSFHFSKNKPATIVFTFFFLMLQINFYSFHVTAQNSSTTLVCPGVNSISWQKCFGGSGKERANAIQQTSEGGYIIACSSSSHDGDITTTRGKSDYWIVKTGSNGELQWQKSYGGTKDDMAYAIQETFDGGYIVAGSTESTDGDVSGSHLNSDYWILKLDVGGNLEWQKAYGGMGIDEAFSIRQTMDGGYIIAGYSKSTNGNVTNNHGNGDYWIVKITGNGVLQWQKAYGGSGYDFANSIEQTRDSGYIVGGFTRSVNGDVTGNHGEEDAWILKLDKNGNLIWKQTYGGTGGEGINSIHQTMDGGYIAAGVTHSNDGDIAGNHGAHDYWILRMDSLGKVKWKNCYGGSRLDNAYDVKQTLDGGFILAGSSTSNDGQVSGSKGLRDFSIMKLDDVGILQWSILMGGIGDDDAYSIQATNDGGYIVAGSTTSNNGDVTGKHDSTDCWIVKLMPPPSQLYYADADADGSGDPNLSTLACSSLPGYVANTSDCNDNNATIRPGGTEVCNGMDDDCNGISDDGIAMFTYFTDADHDGFGSSTVPGTLFCSIPSSGYSANNTDCDDNIPLIHPGAGEFCNNIDDDCDGQPDEECTTFTFYSDADGDSYGNANTWITFSLSVPPAGYVTDNTDCNDADLSVHSPLPYFIDADHDGFGSLIPVALCSSTSPYGYSVNNLDCNDTEATIHPGTVETCNETDDNCNGQLDEDCNMHSFYADSDGDNYGDQNNFILLSTDTPPVGYVTDNTDCNDSDPAIHTQMTFYLDGDHDGFGSLLPVMLCTSIAFPGYSNNSDDCNDLDATRHPGGSEVCNGMDDNCDGMIDNGLTFVTYFADIDHDGFGNFSDPGISLCSNPGTAWVTNNTDCNDNNATVYPNAAELCNNTDDNCNGQIDEGIVSATISPSGIVSTCAGITITLNANAGPSFSYQWKKNGVNISGATNSSYATKIAAIYTVTVSSGSCSVTSAGTTVQVNSLPDATVNPSGTVTVCPGVSIILNASTGTGFTYQWQKDNVNIQQATSSSYTATSKGAYKAIVTNAVGCSKSPTPTTLKNYASLSVKISNTGSLNICSTGSVILSAKAGVGNVYKWFKNNIAIPGATATTYTATQAGSYNYQVTSSDGCSASSANKVVNGCRLGESDIDEPPVVSIYPNPSSGSFMIEMHTNKPSNGIAEIEVINLVGKTMIFEEAPITEGELRCKLTMNNEFPRGMYFVKIMIGDEIFINRIMYQQ